MSDPRKAVTERWRTRTSAPGLTWELMLDGDAILAAVGKHAPLDAARIFEIGPGYGRFLRSLVNSRLPFASYLGLDISEHWVGELAAEFRGRANIEFVCGAAEQADSQTGAREETGTFTRTYARPAIETLLLTAGLSVAAFDEIIHAPGKRRLLVIAVPAG